MSYEVTDFYKDVIDPSEKIPVVLDFWADWCGPCKMLGPILEKLAAEAKGKWKLVKIDTEQNQQIAAQFGIRSIPSVKMVYQKSIVAEFTGALPEPAVRKWLTENLPASQEEEATMEVIQELINQNQRSQARSLLEKYIKESSEDDDLIPKLAVLYLPDELEKASSVKEKFAGEPKYELEEQAIETIHHLARVAAGEISIESKVNEVSATYLKAAEKLFEKDYDTALGLFIDCLIRDRQMDDDGPRKACIAIFTLLGNEHPISQNYRRRFSMALY